MIKRGDMLVPRGNEKSRHKHPVVFVIRHEQSRKKKLKKKHVGRENISFQEIKDLTIFFEIIF